MPVTIRFRDPSTGKWVYQQHETKPHEIAYARLRNLSLAVVTRPVDPTVVTYEKVTLRPMWRDADGVWIYA